MASETGRTSVGLRSARGPILGSVMLCIALVAIDATILAAAVPAIVTDLGGFSQFPWLFSIYLLAQAVSVPIYGKVADSIGRKPVMLTGIGVFLLGSVLCGVAWSMPLLIAARAVQGLGAGAILPISMTIVGDLYTVEERARVQGYIASVWGMSAIIGPSLGGLFSEYLSWRWIFFVNIPVGAIAAGMLLRQFHESVQRRSHRIDVAGAALLTTGCTLLILALLQGGNTWEWDSWISLLLLTLSVVAFVAFSFVERRAAEPIIPLWVFTERLLVAANAVSLIVGAVLIGLTSYVPTFAQGVLGFGALLSGFALAAMTIGWPIAASTAGRMYMRIGFRDTSIIGGMLILVGSMLMLTVNQESSLWAVALYTFVVGLGLGYTASPTLVAVQSAVGWERRGVVTGTNMFARSVGSAIGVAVFGAIANASLADQFKSPPSDVRDNLPTTADDATLVLDPESGATAPLREYVRGALDTATHHVFVGLAVLAVMLLFAVVLMPRHGAAETPD